MESVLQKLKPNSEPEFEFESVTEVLGKNKIQYYTIEQIDEAIEKTIDIFKGLPNIDFNRIQKQIEITRETMYKFSEGIDTVVISAPTGFGKSILAFFISIVTRVLEENFSAGVNGSLDSFKDEFGEFGSYIMTSNKFLQDQYYSDIKRFSLSTHKLLKGKSNYECNLHKANFEKRKLNSLNFANRDNAEYVPIPFDKAKCKDSSLTKLIINGDNGKFPCASRCSYLKARTDAIMAETTVFNYSYFVSTMNLVYDFIGSEAPFLPRHLTIFDECHVLTGVVSDAFSISFDFSNMVYQIRKFSLKMLNGGLGYDDLETKYGILGTGFDQFNTEMLKLSKIYEKSKNEFSQIRDVESHYDTVENNQYIINSIINHISPICTDLVKAYQFICNIDLNSPDNYYSETFVNEIKKECSEIVQHVCSYKSVLVDQRKIYQELGYDSAVIYIDEIKMSEIKRRMVDDFNDTVFTFKCIDESQLVKDKAMKFTNKTILMSATIGKPTDYIKMLKLENAHPIDVESDFDYSVSPIYKLEPEIWLNNKNLETEFPKIINRISTIINHPDNKNVKGIIHTPSHKMAKTIVEKLFDSRLKFVDTRNKNEILENFENDTNTILVSASLIEGVDLKDDLCRFMIFPKVMYPNLMDKLVKKKMKKIAGWYEYTTFVQYQQALGRGVRHKSDYCRSYILDGNFNKFDKNNVTPDIISERYIETPANNLHFDSGKQKEEEYNKRLLELDLMLNG